MPALSNPSLRATVPLFLLAFVVHTGAFLPPVPLSSVHRPTATSTTLFAAFPRGARGLPKIDDWTLLRNGAVRGTISSHPVIDNGDVITTSKLAEEGSWGDLKISDGGVIVVTESGSKYVLGSPSIAMVKSRPKKKASYPFTSSKSKSKPLGEKRKDTTSLQLSGKAVGADRKYLLVGKMIRSTSGKSQIWNGYESGSDGNPTGRLLTLKISTNFEALERENRNYDRITGGIFGGEFVSKKEFLKEAGPDFPTSSALVIDTGKKDLKQLLVERGRAGLRGRAMRDAAAAACVCVQAMHTSSMVWTDLKVENFVVLGDATGKRSEGLPGMKGIDLESAIPNGGNPVDYSPEACPPEFAKEFVAGEGADFVLRPSYDMWSLGMLLYELSVGTNYFEGRNPLAITKMLAIDSFEVELGVVEDEKLRDLIKGLLNTNPKKRLGITQVLLHPYFLTSGIGTFSF